MDTMLGYGTLARTGPRTVVDTRGQVEWSGIILRKIRQNLTYAMVRARDVRTEKIPAGFTGIRRPVPAGIGQLASLAADFYGSGMPAW